MPLPADPPIGYDPSYGGIPQVPDPRTTAGEAISGDIANLPGLQDLASGINAFNTGQAQAPYIANLPGYMNMLNTSSGNILSNLRGELPPDVINLLGQQGAERGVASGGVGSPNSSAAYLRALGLTSLGRKDLGESQLTGAISRTPTAPLFNVASFLTSPADQQTAQYMANLLGAAPNPAAQMQAIMDAINRGLDPSGAGAPLGSTGMPTITGTPAPGVGIGRPPLPISTGAPGGGSMPVGGTRPTGATPTTTGSNPFQGPSPFQGPAINPATGMPSGGFAGPAINPWTGSPSGGFQGPAINPWTGSASGGFQGPNINPWTGEYIPDTGFGSPITSPDMFTGYPTTPSQPAFGAPISSPDLFTGGYGGSGSDWVYDRGSGGSWNIMTGDFSPDAGGAAPIFGSAITSPDLFSGQYYDTGQPADFATSGYWDYPGE